MTAVDFFSHSTEAQQQEVARIYGAAAWCFDLGYTHANRGLPVTALRADALTADEMRAFRAGHEKRVSDVLRSG